MSHRPRWYTPTAITSAALLIAAKLLLTFASGPVGVVSAVVLGGIAALGAIALYRTRQRIERNPITWAGPDPEVDTTSDAGMKTPPLGSALELNATRAWEDRRRTFALRAAAIGLVLLFGSQAFARIPQLSNVVLGFGIAALTIGVLMLRSTTIQRSILAKEPWRRALLRQVSEQEFDLDGSRLKTPRRGHGPKAWPQPGPVWVATDHERRVVIADEDGSRAVLAYCTPRGSRLGPPWSVG